MWHHAYAASCACDIMCMRHHVHVKSCVCGILCMWHNVNATSCAYKIMCNWRRNLVQAISWHTILCITDVKEACKYMRQMRIWHHVRTCDIQPATFSAYIMSMQYLTSLTSCARIIWGLLPSLLFREPLDTILDGFVTTDHFQFPIPCGTHIIKWGTSRTSVA